MKIYIRITGILLLIILCITCKKEITYEGIKGDAKGTVQLYSITSDISDHSGIEILVDGASPEMKTLSGKDGKYILAGLKTGTYDLIFKKEGYVTYKIMSWQFLGGKIPSYVNAVILRKMPDSKVTDLQVDTSYSGVYAKAKIANISQTSYRCFISDKSDVSCDKYLLSSSAYTSSADQNININLNSVLMGIFPKGKKLFLKVYPYAGSSGYQNIETGLISYPVNPEQGSNTAEFTMPYTTFYFN